LDAGDFRQHGMRDFKGKVVLITGASSGIGKALALRVGRQGAMVALVARNQPALADVAAAIEQNGGRALVLPTDVCEASQCQKAVDQTVAHFGKLDIVVCSAGLSMRTYLERSDPAAMERVVRVNFLGTLFVTHAAIPHVRKTRGSLVALSSLTGLRGVPSYSLYGATKFAVQGLYESLRLELRRDGVHVGVVAPGFVDTPLRTSVLGPDGRPWDKPPKPPFRVWPVEKCVDSIVRLIIRRKRQANLPWFMGPLFLLDRLVGSIIGNVILRWRFPPI
jgi:NAD(P)-dependent dehydrogenase (short-subunit alcohol dehydrogenase family)